MIRDSTSVPSLGAPDRGSKGKSSANGTSGSGSPTRRLGQKAAHQEQGDRNSQRGSTVAASKSVAPSSGTPDREAGKANSKYQANGNSSSAGIAGLRSNKVVDGDSAAAYNNSGGQRCFSCTIV